MPSYHSPLPKYLAFFNLLREVSKYTCPFSKNCKKKIISFIWTPIPKTYNNSKHLLHAYCLPGILGDSVNDLIDPSQQCSCTWVSWSAEKLRNVLKPMNLWMKELVWTHGLWPPEPPFISTMPSCLLGGRGRGGSPKPLCPWLILPNCVK